MKQRLLALLLAAGLVLSMAACGDPASDSSSDPSADPSSTSSEEIVADLTQDLLPFAAGMEASDTALTVNGQEVPADLFLYWLALNCAYFQQNYGLPLDGSYGNAVLQDSLTMTAYYVIMEQKVLEEGCPLTDEQRSEIQAEMVADGQETYDNRKLLFNLTDETMEFIYSVSDYYDNLLHTLTSAPTQDELNQYVYQAKHILLLTVDMDGTPTVQDGAYVYPSLDEETIAEKKALADDLLSQLRSSDDPEALFDELMNEYSEDTGLESNPDGYTTTVGQMVPAFEETALSLEFGEISDVVESSYGYHIILRGEVEDLDSYADQYRQSLLDARIDQWLEDAEVTPVEAIENLDVANFYNRYNAWQTAMAEQLQADSDSDASASPAQSGSAEE